MSTELRDLARTIAVEAGSLARTRREEGVTVAATKSSLVDVVTEADREVEAFIRQRLAELRPSDGFFGEETGAEPGSPGLTWLVDPIDGTVNYLYGRPHYCTSIAVVEGEPDPQSWRALAGAVYSPVEELLWEASLGGGAERNGRTLSLADPPPLSEALIGTGFAYDAEMRAAQGRVLAALIPHVRDIRRQGAAALDLCGVADGTLDAFYERTLNPWDHAAGVLIIEEAGGVARGMDGTRPDDRMVVAGPPSLVTALESRILGDGNT